MLARVYLCEVRCTDTLFFLTLTCNSPTASTALRIHRTERRSVYRPAARFARTVPSWSSNPTSLVKFGKIDRGQGSHQVGTEACRDERKGEG